MVSSLRKTVRHVERRREELEHLAMKRWNTLDILVLRSLSMFLGAVYVSILSALRPDDMQVQYWYVLRLVIVLAIDPIILLYITKYWPPSTVEIPNGSDTLKFQVVANLKVSFHRNSDLQLDDIESVDLLPERNQVVLKQAADSGSAEGKAKLFSVDLVGQTWPKHELGHVISMVEGVNASDFGSCSEDFQVLTTKVVVQVLCWTIRDFIANSTFHEWNASVWEDFGFATVLFLLFAVITWIAKIFKQKSFSSYHGPPFLTEQETWMVGFRRILSTYLQVILLGLPLSVGFSWNQVFRDLHMEVMAATNIQMDAATRGETVLFSYAVYFLILAIVTVGMRVYAKSVVNCIFTHRIIQGMVDLIDAMCCCSICKEQPAEEAQAAEEAKASSGKEVEAAAPAAPARGTGEPVVEQSEKDRQEQGRDRPAVQSHTLQPAAPVPSVLPDDERGAHRGDPQLLGTIAVLQKQVQKLEKAIGMRGTPPLRQDDDEIPSPINRHWKAATVATVDEVSLKTLQFLFAWAALYLLEYLYFTYLVGCSTTSSDASQSCTYQSSLGLAMILSTSSLAYLYLVAGLRRQPPLHEAFFDLQLQAIPLTVGWTWKGFVDDVLAKLQVEWAGSSMLPVYVVLFLTMYIFGLLVFHTYSIISRDQRSKYVSL